MAEVQEAHNNNFVIGIIVQMVGCIAIALGLCVEKYSMVKAAKKRGHAQSNWSDPVYLCGFAMFIVGNILSAVALSFAAAAVLAPLSCLNIVANTFFSSLLLHELVTSNDILSTIVIMSGAGLVVMFSDHSSPKLTAADIRRMVTRRHCMIYVGVMAALVAALRYRIPAKKPNKESESKPKKARSINLDLPPGIHPSTSDEETRELVAMKKSAGGKRMSSVDRHFGLIDSDAVDSTAAAADLGTVFCFAALSAAFGAGSYICAKTMSTMIANIADGTDTAHDALILLVPAVVLVIWCATMQIRWMNAALETCDCLTVVPMYYALAILLQSFSGGIVYEEFGNFTAKQSFAFGAGVAVLLAGVYQLSRGQADKDTGELAKLSLKLKQELPEGQKHKPHALWKHVRLNISSIVNQNKAKTLRRLRAASSRRITIGCI